MTARPGMPQPLRLTRPSYLPKQRKGDLFMLGIDMIFFIAIILVFWKLAAAFTQANGAEGLGTRQTAVLSTYAMSERMLLYVDEAAKFSGQEALVKLAAKGGTVAPSACGAYAGYQLWSYSGTPCFPSTVQDDHDSVTERFRLEFDNDLAHTLQYPGMPQLHYTYLPIDATNGLTIRGISSSVGSSRVDLQACKLEYSIVSPK